MLVFYIPLATTSTASSTGGAWRKARAGARREQQPATGLRCSHGRPHAHRRPGRRELLHRSAATGSDRALIVDPGDEADRHPGARSRSSGVERRRRSCSPTRHFDHIGAVAPVAKATGAPVWCPEIEVPVLADIMSFVPWPGFGPFESYEADAHASRGGEKLELAGLEIDVIFTPGHSPGPRHLLDPRRAGASSPATCSSRARSAAPTCPAATGRRCSSRSARWSTRCPPETAVYPGHMGVTTLGAERATNPFLRRARAVAARR